MPITLCERFGKRVRQLRARHGWSQEELAHRVGIDTNYLSQVELGKKEPCLVKIGELAQGFNITIARLMQGI